MSLADLSIAAPLADTARAQLPVTRLANAQRWFDRVQALEAWQRTEAA